MVIAEKVQAAVHNEHTERILYVHIGSVGGAFGIGIGDYDITEVHAIVGIIVGHLASGKRQDVCRAVQLAMFQIQLLHRRIVGYHNCQLRSRICRQACQHRFGRSSQA